MINKIIFAGDLCRGDQSINITRTYRLFSAIFQKYDAISETYITETNKCSGTINWMDTWLASLRGECKHDFSSVDLEGAGVVGFELSDADRGYLSECGIPWVNLSIHPIRFLDDLCWDVSCSFDYDFSNIITSKSYISLCADMIMNRHSVSNELPPNKPKSLLIIGQTPFDRSVYYDGSLNSLGDYIDQLDALTADHECVYYRPHPHQSDPKVDALIHDRFRAIIDRSPDFYGFLATKGLVTGCAISSSTLFELPYFGIKAVGLLPRPPHFGPAIRHCALIDDQHFWARGFLGRGQVKGLEALSSATPRGHLRDVFSAWGFMTRERELDLRLQALETALPEENTRAKDADLVARLEAAEAAQLNAEGAIERLTHEHAARESDLVARLEAAEAAQLNAEGAIERLTHEHAARESDLVARLETKAALVGQLLGQIDSLESSNAALIGSVVDLQAKINASERSHHEKLAMADTQINALSNINTLVGGELAAVYASTSWRITRPFRGVSRAARAIAAPKEALRRTAERGLVWLSGRPRMRRWTVSLLRVLPPLERRLRQFATVRGYGPVQLPPPAQPIWALDCAPDSLAEWQRLVSGASRTHKGRRRT
jgi:hypothetical protein